LSGELYNIMYTYINTYMCLGVCVCVCVIVQNLTQKYSNYQNLLSLKLVEKWLVDSHNLFPSESSVLKCEAVVLISYQYVIILAHFTVSTIVSRLCMGFSNPFLLGTLKNFLLEGI
jgi:lysylphosphatidylglycerol synthetase-like protein (DUF2156 family)